MQYNKQRSRSAVSFAPCAIVEKPHQNLWVLKDKSWLVGRESVMQLKNCVFHPNFPLSFFFLSPLFFLPLLSKFCLSPNSLYLSAHFDLFSISFSLWHISLSCNTLQPKMLQPPECSVKEEGGLLGGGTDQHGQLRRRLR